MAELDSASGSPLAAFVARRPRRVAFAGVFAAGLLSFLGVGAVLPVLPRYIRGPIGAGDVWVGVVTGAFAFAAIAARPVAGRLSDRVGRRRVVVTGALLTATAGVLYLVPAGVPGLLVARLVLGAGEGAVFTAGATWALDLAPEEIRGRVVGLYGLSVWGGLSIGPAVGGALQSLGGYDLVWTFAAASPLLGALVASRVRDPHVPPAAGAEQPRGPLVPPATWRPGIALALANAGYAAVIGFLVLHLDRRGIGHGALVFTAFAAAVVGTRILAGRLPDRYGGRTMAAVAGLAEAAGLMLLAAAHTLGTAIAGAVVMGFGFSTLFPALLLLVVDRVEAERRGAAVGVFTAFFDLGVGLGAPIAGAIAALAGYPAAFWAGAGMAACGVVIALSVRVTHVPHHVVLPGPPPD